MPVKKLWLIRPDNDDDCGYVCLVASASAPRLNSEGYLDEHEEYIEEFCIEELLGIAGIEMERGETVGVDAIDVSIGARSGDLWFVCDRLDRNCNLIRSEAKPGLNQDGWLNAYSLMRRIKSFWRNNLEAYCGLKMRPGQISRVKTMKIHLRGKPRKARTA